MGKKKVGFSRDEWMCAIRALNALRNEYIAEGRYTDVLDELILKIDRAPIRRVKVKALAQ